MLRAFYVFTIAFFGDSNFFMVGRVEVGMGFVDLTDKDDNGYCCVNARGCKVLVSTNVTMQAVGGKLGRTNVDVRVVHTMFIARSRTSRVGTMNKLNRGLGVPVCAATQVRRNVGQDCYVARGLCSSIHCLRGRRPVRLRSFRVRSFRMPRSNASGINCYVRVSKGIFIFLASLNRVAPATTRCVEGTGCLVLRTGCSRRVLHVNACPRCLGRQVADHAKRVDGVTATRFLSRGVARRLRCV